MNTAESLATYVAPDDRELVREEFLFAVATRILDDLGILHGFHDLRHARLTSVGIIRPTRSH